MDANSAAAATHGLLDGNWVDMCSLALAVVYGCVKAYRTGGKYKIVSKTTALYVANGISLFPLLLLFLSTFSSEILQSVIQSNKVILSVAGAVALFAILEDFGKPTSAP